MNFKTTLQIPKNSPLAKFTGLTGSESVKQGEKYDNSYFTTGKFDNGYSIVVVLIIADYDNPNTLQYILCDEYSNEVTEKCSDISIFNEMTIDYNGNSYTVNAEVQE